MPFKHFATAQLAQKVQFAQEFWSWLTERDQAGVIASRLGVMARLVNGG